MDDILKSYTIRDIVRIIYLNKVFFIIFPLIFVLPAYIGYEMITPTYIASVTMYVKAEKKSEADFYNNVSSPNIVGDHAQLLTSNIVLSRVVDALKLYELPDDYSAQYYTPMKRFFTNTNSGKTNENISTKSDSGMGRGEALGLLLSHMKVLPSGESNLFVVQYEDFDRVQAARIANSISRSYVIFDLEQQVEELKLKYGEKHSTVLQLENYIELYKKHLDGELIPDLEAMGPASVKIIAQAVGARRQTRASEPLLLFFAFFTGIFVAAVFTAVSEYYNNTFRTPKDVVKYLNMPFIGSIPKRKKNDELIMSEEHLAQSSLKCVNSFQRLGDKICLLSKRENIKSILITAFQDLSDASALIANLGIYLSRDAGKKVLIIDANLLNPKLAKVFHISENSGLPEILEKKKTFEEVVVNVGKNLDLLLSHTVSYRPIALLDSPSMPNLIGEVRDKYDFVLLDCSSSDLKRDTEPAILSSFTDAVILVVTEGIDRFQDAKIVMNNLSQNGDRVIFSVLNNRKEDMPNILYKIS